MYEFNNKEGELISARKTSHGQDNKDVNYLRELSPGMRVNTRYKNSTNSTSSKRDTPTGHASKY